MQNGVFFGSLSQRRQHQVSALKIFFHITVSGHLVCGCSNFHFASHLLIKAALQRPARQPLFDASSLGAVSRPFNPAAVCGAAQRSCVLRTYRPSFMVLLLARTSACVSKAENAAFQVYFGVNPCSVVLGFLLRLHLRLSMSSKCCCCQSPISTLQRKTTRLNFNMKWKSLSVKSIHLSTCFRCIIRYGAVAASLLSATLACARC